MISKNDELNRPEYIARRIIGELQIIGKSISSTSICYTIGHITPKYAAFFNDLDNVNFK